VAVLGRQTGAVTRTWALKRTWPIAVPLPTLGLAAVLVAYQGWSSALIGAVVIVTGSVALLILRRHPTQRIGWLLALHSLLVCVIAPGGSGGGRWQLALGQLLQGGWVLMLVCLVLIAYLFPDGHALSRRWRAWIIVFLAAYAVFLVVAASDRSGFAEAFPGHEPPLPTLWQPLVGILGIGSLAFVPASLIGAVVSARRRLKRSGDERLQMLWFTLTALSLPVMMGLLWTAHFVGLDRDAVTYPVLAVGLSAIPVGIGIGILRWGLFDIELVLSRALTYSVLTLVVVGVYGLLLAVTERLFHNRSAGGLLAAGVVAVVVHPAYARLRRRIERWVYGYRSEPHEALRMLADRAASADPLQLTESITATVAESLKVDRVWVEQLGHRSPPGSNVVRTPLVHRGVRLGDLAVEVPDGRQFSASDAALFTDLARHAAVLVRADRLTAELRQSRARLVTAREEERRRLRRDLHDGVGPSLAAIVLKLNAAQTRSTEDDRNALLAETRDEARAAIAEVRRLVDDLRPPAIDEVGLLGAIRQRVTSLSGDLAVDIVGPDSLPQLPAAVEVAAFRIASEAVTNVVRHSGASRCLVVVELDGAFALTVSDNGRGADEDTGQGMGWTSMRQRAAELGGSCTISSRAEGGVVVRAVLPLVDAPDATDAEVTT
jgi:two-component system, NarL family, sensor kinase